MYDTIFRALLKEAGITDYETEHKFHPTRRWRFDYAVLKKKIAWELEGGVWSGGRHTNPKGFMGDCEKYNEAALLGWTVYRIPTVWLNEEPKLVERFLVE